MKNTIVIWVLVLIIIIGGGWYWLSQRTTGTDAENGAPSDATGINGSTNQGNFGEPDAAQPQDDGTDVSQNLILGIAGDEASGVYLTAYNGMTVYTYSKDSDGVSVCTGTCAENWPPYVVPSQDAIHVPASITGAVGTIVRADGTLQVTYRGMPLYFYIKDTQPGDIVGQGVGGVWYVVQP